MGRRLRGFPGSLVVIAGDDLSTFLLVTVTEAAHSKTKGQAVRLTTGSPAWVLAQANSDTTLDDGLVYDVTDVNTYRVLIGEAVVPWTAHGLGSAGNNLYLSRAVAGAIATTAPVSGEVERYVGFVLDANNVVRSPSAPQWVV